MQELNNNVLQEFYTKQSQLDKEILKLIAADGFPYYLDRRYLTYSAFIAFFASFVCLSVFFIPNGYLLLIGISLFLVSLIILMLSEFVAMKKIKNFWEF